MTNRKINPPTKSLLSAPDMNFIYSQRQFCERCGTEFNRIFRLGEDRFIDECPRCGRVPFYYDFGPPCERCGDSVSTNLDLCEQCLFGLEGSS